MTECNAEKEVTFWTFQFQACVTVPQKLKGLESKVRFFYERAMTILNICTGAKG